MKENVPSGLSRRLALAGVAVSLLPACRPQGSQGTAAERVSMKLKWKFTDKVEITAEDIAWFRACRSTWIRCEAGAPAIVPGDMFLDDFEDALDEEHGKGLSRFEKVVCAFFLNARFSAGRYALRQPLEGRTSFGVTDEHFRLLRAAVWRAAMIDCKRPYGDYTNYPIDMARILGLPITRNPQGYDEISAQDDARMVVLHEEMLFVVQAYIEHAELAPGRWLVPWDGWDSRGIFGPRCTPPTAAQAAAYQHAIAAIHELVERRFKDPPADFTFIEWALRERGGEVQPRSVAGAELRNATTALFKVEPD